MLVTVEVRQNLNFASIQDFVVTVRNIKFQTNIIKKSSFSICANQYRLWHRNSDIFVMTLLTGLNL